MKTYKLIEKLINRKGVIVFSDPAGAKACLSIASKLDASNIAVICDRRYDFFNDFNIEVKFPPRESLEEYFEAISPEFVLTGTSLPEKIEIEFIRNAKQKNIKTFSFVDHWTNIKKRFISGGEIVYPSEIWLIDEEAECKAKSENIPEELIKIVGNPYYEYLKKWKPNLTKQELYKKLNLQPNSQYILYAPEPFSKFNLQKKYGFDELSGLKYLEKAILEIGINNITVLVKGHPNQEDKIFNDYIEQKKSNTIYVKDYNINDLICHAKLVTGYFSNSMIEANVMGKQVLRMIIGLKDSELDLLRNKNIGKVVSTQLELNSEIRTTFMN